MSGDKFDARGDTENDLLQRNVESAARILLEDTGQECRRGDYIVYEPSEEVKTLIIKNGWGDGERDFLKKVGATAGERYSVDAETLKFEIEGKYIGQVYETDNARNVLPKLRGEYEVPKDYVLPIATSVRSFDGRYIGAIPKSQIKARVVPILTW